MNETNKTELQPIAMVISSYVIWGLFPLYFYIIRAIPASEVMAHRVIGALLIVLVFDWLTKPSVRWFDLIRNRKQFLFCTLTALLLSINWLVTMWAVMNGHALEGSLGFFMNPLVNIFIGMIFFKESLSKAQLFALGMTLVAVIYLTVSTGKIPWVAIILSLSFALYGSLRKHKKLPPFAGLAVETIIATPVALAFLAYLYQWGEPKFATQGHTVATIGVLFSGFVTILPLILFLSALPKLKLSLVGFLQYITPTLNFILAITVLGEHIDSQKLYVFIMIWISLIIFMIAEFSQRQKRNS